MAEYSRSAKGNFTATGTSATAASQIVPLPFIPDFVIVRNYTNFYNSPAQNKTLTAFWDASFIDTANSTNPTWITLYPNGSSTFEANDTIQTNGITTFSGGIAQQYGASKQIIGITKASQASVNVSAHGLNVGDVVVFQGIALNQTTNDMQLLNNVPFSVVSITDANNFLVNWNTNQSTYTAISGSPSRTIMKKVLYPYLYLPQDNVISGITTGATTTVKTTMYHNLEIGQEVAFRIPQQWGTTQLNSLPNVLIPGQPIYGYVVSLTDNWTFVVNINSSSYTAYTSNFTLPSATLAGLNYPQVVPVGDVNTGGKSIFAGSALYPPPSFPLPNNSVGTINGPAIKGAFVNNTSMGFIIGVGTARTNTGATIMTTGDQVEWEAFLHDYSNP